MNRALQVLAAAAIALAPAQARAQTAAAPATAKPNLSAIVPREHWAYEAASILSTKELGGQLAGPNHLMSRQEFAWFLVRAFEILPDETHLLRKYRLRKLPNGNPAHAEATWEMVGRAEINDLLEALRREFAAEADELTRQLALNPAKPHAAAIPAQADARQSSDSLDRLQKSLSSLFVGKWQGATARYWSDGAEAEFHCDDFAVHPTEPDGKIASWFSTQRGPNHDGFLLRLSLRGNWEGELLLRPHDEREPYWTTWKSEFRLNTRETDAAKVAASAKKLGPSAAEYPDVPRQAWPYKAIETLAQFGIIEGLPNGNYSGNKAMTRYEFGVAMARLLDRMQDKARLSPAQAAAIDKPENRVLINDLAREFAGEISRLGVRLAPTTAYFVARPGVRHQILQVELSFGRDTDAAQLESIKRVLNDWALEGMSAALALPEAQPQKPQVLAP